MVNASAETLGKSRARATAVMAQGFKPEISAGHHQPINRRKNVKN